MTAAPPRSRSPCCKFSGHNTIRSARKSRNPHRRPPVRLRARQPAATAFRVSAGMQRTFGLDAVACPRCGGRLRPEDQSHYAPEFDAAW